jgi:hypothetical protein
LNWKIALTKRKKNQKNKGQNENNKTTKTLIEWWNWKSKKPLTKESRKTIKKKRPKWKTKHMRNCNWITKLKKTSIKEKKT